MGRLPLGLLHGIGSGVAAAQWSLNSRAALNTRRNLALCWPQLSAAAHTASTLAQYHRPEALARASLRQTGMLALEAGVAWGLPESQVLRQVRRVSGEDRLLAAVAAGDGVIICAPHLGNWEIMNRFLGSRWPMTAMYEPPTSTLLDGMLRRVRSQDQSILVPTNAQGVRALLATLREGGMIGVLPDQTPPRNAGGVYAPFFGRSALTSTLTGKLASRTGATVLLSVAIRRPASDGFDLHFEHVAGVGQSDPDRANTSQEQIAARINAALEAAIVRWPDQYQWEYKRFKHQPVGTRDWYK